MRRLLKYTILFGMISILLITGTGFSQEEEGGQPGAFTRIGVGSRAMGMGRAFTAIADDASSAYWNPAGLGNLSMTEIMGNISILSMERRYNYAAVAFPLSSLGTISISWINLDIGEIESRNALNQIGEMFSNSENAYYLTWGLSINRMISIGLGTKYITHNLSSNHATGLGFDAGILFAPYEGIRLGFTIHDLSTAVKWDTDSGLKETFPLVTRVGGAFSPTRYPVTIGIDVEQVQNQKYSYHAGIEADLIYGTGLRLGMDNGRFAVGGSVSVPWGENAFQTDLSLGQDPIDKSYVYRVSVSLRFKEIRLTTPRAERESPENLQGYMQMMTPPPDARVIKITEQYPDYALINAGSNQGIVEDMVLSIYRLKRDEVDGGEERVRIGNVVVVKVEEEASAVHIQWMMDDYTLEVGDVLIYDVNENPVSQVMPQFNQ